MEQTEQTNNLEPETRNLKPETEKNLQPSVSQRLQAHRHGAHTNFYDPNNPVFNKDHTEERSKQILAALFFISGIIFVIWWVLSTF